MEIYNFFIYFTFFIKIVFLISTLGIHFVQKMMKETTSKTKLNELAHLEDNLLKINTQSDFVFITCMSLLLVYLFNPRRGNKFILDHETKMLLFLYGIIILIQAKWKDFFNHSIILKNIQPQSKKQTNIVKPVSYNPQPFSSSNENHYTVTSIVDDSL